MAKVDGFKGPIAGLFDSGRCDGIPLAQSIGAMLLARAFQC